MTKWKVQLIDGVKCLDGTTRHIFVGEYPNWMTVGDRYTSQEFIDEFGFEPEDGHTFTTD